MMTWLSSPIEGIVTAEVRAVAPARGGEAATPTSILCLLGLKTWRSRVAFAAYVATLVFALTVVAATPLRPLLLLLCLSEVWFMFAYAAHAASLSSAPSVHAPARHDPRASLEYAVKQINFFFNAMSAPLDGRAQMYLGPWFFHTAGGANANSPPSLECIRRQNVVDLVAYGFHYLTRGQVLAEGRLQEVEDAVDQLQELCHIRLKPGHNPDLTFMAHLWQPLPHAWRPLAFYLGTEALFWATHVAMRALGFSCRVVAGQPCYVRSARAARRAGAQGADAAAAPEPPILFLHGVGLGLLPYLLVLVKLGATGRALLCPVFNGVSMRWSERVAAVEECADAAAALVAAVGAERAEVVGHSFGTLVASALVQRHPALASSLTLVDPVCLAMFLPTLLRTFLYTGPSSDSPLLDALLRLVSSEVHVTATFCRRFYWTALKLEARHMPPRTLVVLSGRDALCPAQEVHAWLKACTHAQVLFHPDTRHAEFVLNPRWQRRTLDAFTTLIAKGGGDGSETGAAVHGGADTPGVPAASGDVGHEAPRLRLRQTRLHDSVSSLDYCGRADSGGLPCSDDCRACSAH